MASELVSITGLQNLVNLQEFRGDYNSFTEIDFSGLTNLTYVDVSDCEIPGTSTHSLVSINLSGCTALQELRLDDSNFLAGLSNLAGLNNLEWLDLDQCNITGSVNLSSLTNLRGFDLYGNGGLTEVIISNSQPLGDGKEIYLYDCALTQTAVDNILVALSTNGITGGYLDMEVGTNAAPSSTGLAAKLVLEGNGWNVYVNS
jgi:Leucine-rich repeat (LRR) protein